MALKVLPTNNPGYNPYTSGDISNTDFTYIIDQGFRNTRVDLQLSRVAGDIWYTKVLSLPLGEVVIHITEIGVYVEYDNLASGESSLDTDSWLFASFTFQSAYNNMVDFITSRIRPAAS